jgi:hypothetical protein
MNFAHAFVAAALLATIDFPATAQQKWDDDCAQPNKDALLTRGCAALDEYMKAFNARDVVLWTQTLNYPHVRLAAGQVSVWNTPNEYRLSTDFAQFAAANQGWLRSEWDWRRLVQQSPEKLHYLVQFTRYGEGGIKIASFGSLYVLTLKEGRWGVQARSSFAGIYAQGAPL